MPSGISELFFEVQKITGSNGKIKAERRRIFGYAICLILFIAAPIQINESLP